MADSGSEAPVLRQRRAARETGRDPAEAHLRPPEVVEKYVG